MRILICAAFYPPYRGGYAESVRALAEGFFRNGHAVTVIACAPAAGYYFDHGRFARVISLPSWNPSFLHGSFPLPRPFSAISAFRLAMRERPDIVYTNTRFFPITWLGFFFAKFYRAPVTHIERGAGFPVSHNPAIAVIGACIDHTLGRIVCSFSDHVVGVSDAACAFARRLGARNPACIRTGIDRSFWRRPDGMLSDSPFHITYAGRLVHGKGVHDLLAAVALLRPLFPLIRLSVVGDGPSRPFLARLASSLGIADAVSFAGELDASGVRSFLWRSALFVNPSYSEGFPRAVLEAIAAGIPVIATDVGGTRELALFGSVALVLPGQPAILAEAIRGAFSHAVLFPHEVSVPDPDAVIRSYEKAHPSPVRSL